MAAALFLSAVFAPSAQAGFGFKSVAAGFTEEDGSPATQAGSHPFAWTASFALNTVGSGPEEAPDGSLKDLRIQLPPGLVAAPDLLPQCSQADYFAESCTAASEVGTIALDVSAGEAEAIEVPLYNLEPLPGNAAELAFTAQKISVVITLHVSSVPPYNLVAEITKVSQVADLLGASLTLHGLLGAVPFLTLPRSCSSADATFEADSWQAAGAWVSATAPEPLSPTGCGKLGFSPALIAEPGTAAARAPSGLDLSLDLPSDGLTSPTGIANADLTAATIDLPVGMAVNPALAAGLAACSPTQLAAETPFPPAGEGCPQAAMIGTAELASPLLDTPLEGTVFVAAPNGPLDGHYGLYLVLRASQRGVLLRLPIGITADPVSGRLSATVADLPQLPFSHFELHFKSGPRAPLVTPPCGVQTIAYSLTPSSGAAPTSGTHAFTTSSNCTTRTFHPSLSAGTVTNAAGSAAPFVLDLSVVSGETQLAAVDLTLPPGLSADLAGVPACPEPDAGNAACPPSSRLGSARIAVGPGSEPLWIPEAAHEPSAVYLAGPYQGAPYSLLIKVPAQAGPFDLGTVVLRAPIRIDPRTAQAEISIEGLPQILAGVPIQYRHIRLLLDRQGFIRNPTSCEPTRIAGTATSVDGVGVELASRFQAADCGALPFRPRVALHLSGGLARNGHPSLRAVLRPRSGEAGIAAAGFTLPAGELLDLHHLRALCARDLPPDHCPASSRLGHVRLWSPLVETPFQGPIYLREPSHRLPDLLADLRSGGVHIVLRGHSAAPRGRLRIQLPSLPDVPLSKAVIAFAGGRRGILVNSESLCGRRLRAGANLRAHSGKSRQFQPRIRLHGRC